GNEGEHRANRPYHQNRFEGNRLSPMRSRNPLLSSSPGFFWSRGGRSSLSLGVKLSMKPIHPVEVIRQNNREGQPAQQKPKQPASPVKRVPVPKITPRDAQMIHDHTHERAQNVPGR